MEIDTFLSEIRSLTISSLWILVLTGCSFDQTYSFLLDDLGLDTSSKNNCQYMLKTFAESSANFTLCAVENARPIKLCELCVPYYLGAQQAHDNILQVEDESGKSCRFELMNLDRLEIIEDAYSYVSNLWQRGKCDYCFIKTENGTLTPEPSSYTLTFQKLHKELYSCINQTQNNVQRHNESIACKMCEDHYLQLNDFYEQLKGTDGNQPVCVDIVDSMNSSRTNWSKTLGCCRRVMKFEAPLICTAVLIALAPAIFYTAAKRFASGQPSRLLQQKRFLVIPSTSANER